MFFETQRGILVMSTQKILTKEEVAERKEALKNWNIPINQLFATTINGSIVPIENTFEAREQFRLEELTKNGFGH